MDIDLYKVMSSNEGLLLFVALGMGYLIGNIKIGSIEIGSTTGVLLSGLLLGHLGFKAPEGLGAIGFVLFIYCVGLQAGPRFFGVFLEDGRKYIALAAVIAISAVATTLGISSLIHFEYGIPAGIIAGALTSTPTLIGAQDAIGSGLAQLPSGMTIQAAKANISVGYAITYIFGTAGLIVIIRYFPIWLKIDLPAEAARLAKEKGIRETDAEGEGSGGSALPVIRAYKLTEDSLIGKNLGDLQKESNYRFAVQAIKRGDTIIDPEPGTVTENDDIFVLVGKVQDHERAREVLGPEVLDQNLIDYTIDSSDVVITNDEVTGIPIGELDLTREYGCFPTEIVRSQIHLPPESQTTLAKGDILRISGERSRLALLASKLGHMERNIQETDLLTFAFGIAAGILAGTIMVKLGGINIGIGSAGGLLLTGILIGYLRSIHPTFGRVPPAARYILMELGLMVFMVGVGLRAGGGIVEALLSVGPVVLISGVIVTLTPVVVGYFFGTYVLKLNPVILLGAITGAMTSTPSLNIVTQAAKSSLPGLGYAGTYTFANVFLTFAGSLMMRI